MVREGSRDIIDAAVLPFRRMSGPTDCLVRKRRISRNTAAISLGLSTGRRQGFLCTLHVLKIRVRA